MNACAVWIFATAVKKQASIKIFEKISTFYEIKLTFDFFKDGF